MEAKVESAEHIILHHNSIGDQKLANKSSTDQHLFMGKWTKQIESTPHNSHPRKL